jgi:hypothetical protein
MISSTRLTQIKDIYDGDMDILDPLIELVKSHGFPLEILPVKKGEEWMVEYQVYEPLPDFAYLIRAAKIALPTPLLQMACALQTYLVADNYEQWSAKETEILLASNKVRELIKSQKSNRGIAVSLVCKRDKLQEFAELVKNAGVE